MVFAVTILAPISVVSQVSTFPFVETFDSVVSPNLPSGWVSTQNRTPGTNDFTTTSSTPNSPPNAVISTNATISQSLVTPAFDFSNVEPDRISFYTRRTATHLAKVVLEASTDNGATFTMQIGDSLTNTGTTNYVYSSFVLPSLLANRIGVRFRWRIIADASGNTGNFRIDDVQLTVRVTQDLSVARIRFSPAIANEGDSVTALATIKNVGVGSASSFLVHFFVDANNDSIPQPSELVWTVSHQTPLPVGDSVSVSGPVGRFSPGRRNIIVRVLYAEDQNPSNDQLLAVLTVGYVPRTIVVNEIMYAPTSTEPEWVELFNTRGEGIDLKDWLVSDNVVTSKKVISTSSAMIPARGFVILTRDSAALVDIHPDIPARVIAVTGFPTLNNTGDAVIIYDSRVATMDSVAYLPSWGGNTGGKSLERVDPIGPSNQPVNWGTSRNVERSTPGRRNSVSRKDYDLRADSLVFFPRLPTHGDSIILQIKVRNIGYQEIPFFRVNLFDDTNADSLPQPTELIYSLERSAPLPPLDSVFIDFPAYYPFHNDHQFIATVESVEDEDFTNNRALARVRVGYRQGAAVISEIMYAPANEPEWVEVYNVSDGTIDLKNWKISNRTSTTRYAISSTSVPVGSNSYVVVTKDTAQLLNRYGHVDGVVIQVPSLPTFLFNNAGDAVVVFDNTDSPMDSVRYFSSWGGSNGTSLERIDLLGVSNDSTNWTASADSMRATPGRENSQTTLDHDLRVTTTASISVPPGNPVFLAATVKNIGRMVSTEFDVAFFDDRNLDSLASPDELVARVRIVQSLARMETLRVSSQWPDPPPGIHNVIVRIEYPPDMRTSNNSRIFSVRIGYPPGAAIVNEIMYAPLTNEAEYVEVMNAGANPIDLSGWRLFDRPTPSGSVNQYTLSTRTLPVQPGELFVIASDSSILARFPHLRGFPRLRIVNQSSLSLNNDGDAVVLRDASGSTIDSMEYAPSWHNPSITDKSGRSLERIHPSLPSNDRRSWSTCVVPAGGTPGLPNSVMVQALPAQASVSFSPNPFSPDGDGSGALMPSFQAGG